MGAVIRKAKQAKRSKSSNVIADALRATGVGIGFAIVVGVLIVLASRVPIFQIPFRAVALAGTDLGMRVAASRFVDRGGDIRVVEGALEPTYTFLDVSDDACDSWLRANPPSNGDRAAAQGEDECLHPAASRLMTQLAVQALEWAGDAPPRLIVFDAWVPNPILVRVAPLLANVPIVALARTRPKLAGERIVLEDRQRLNAVSLPANFVFSTDLVLADSARDGDAAIRRYPAARAVRPAGELSVDTLLPSTGFAVAGLASDASAAYSLFHDFASPESQSCAAPAVEAASRKLHVDAAALCTKSHATGTSGAAYEVDKKILFSLKTLAPPPQEASGRDQVRYSGASLSSSVYRRIPVTFEDGFRRIAAEQLSGRVVIIGSSALSAGDWHLTPLGYMTGPEVIINAARSFRLFDTPAEEPLISQLAHKVVLSVIGGFALLPCWIVVYRLVATRDGRMRAKAAWSKAIGLFYAGLIAVTFLIGMLFAMYVVFRWTISEAVAAYGTASAPADVLTPVLAASLEGFAEGAKVLKAFLEKVVHRLRFSWPRLWASTRRR
jgi:hypothetical protein